METQLAGKTALVTGGGAGIGRAIALALARRGAAVAVTYFEHGEAGQATASDIKACGAAGHALGLDVTDVEMVAKTVPEAARLLDGHIDILVNNAGTLIARKPFVEITNEIWRRVMALNLDSAFYVTQAALPFMDRGWGRIVNLSSIAARNGGGQGAVAYAAAKAGLIGLTRGLAKELAPRGITVNALAPGIILGTAFHQNYTPPETMAALLKNIPVGRAGAPEEVAAAVVYLASDLAGFVTGEVMEINGGAWFV